MLLLKVITCNVKKRKEKDKNISKTIFKQMWNSVVLHYDWNWKTGTSFADSVDKK